MDRLTDPGYIPERIVVNMSSEQKANMYKKLCEYENTGLTPEEIKSQTRNLKIAYSIIDSFEKKLRI